MRNTNPNCYVQYINKTGHIKVKELEREVEASEIIYNLYGIDEDFFLLSVFENNQRVLGLTFGNVQNLDMISFLNSDFQSVDALPEIAFLTANQYVAIVKDTQIYDINFTPITSKQMTNEELYFSQYLKYLYPNNTFTIEAFAGWEDVIEESNVYYYASCYGWEVLPSLEALPDYPILNTHDWILFRGLQFTNPIGAHYRGYKAVIEVPPIDPK